MQIVNTTGIIGYGQSARPPIVVPKPVVQVKGVATGVPVMAVHPVSAPVIHAVTQSPVRSAPTGSTAKTTTATTSQGTNSTPNTSLLIVLILVALGGFFWYRTQ